MERANAEADKIRTFVESEITDAYGEAEFLSTSKETDILFKALSASYKDEFDRATTKDEIDSLIE
jgi:hypothetical protein